MRPSATATKQARIESRLGREEEEEVELEVPVLPSPRSAG